MNGFRRPLRVTLATIAAICLAAPAMAQHNCFPTCASDDGKFLSVAGTGLATFNDARLNVSLGLPSGSTELTLGIFDGDIGGFWDNLAVGALNYTVFADPDGDGTGLVELDSWTDAACDDNAWSEFVIPAVPAAQSANGNYFFRLVVEPVGIGTFTAANFKLRVQSEATLSLKPQSFSFVGALFSMSDAEILYPAWPALTPTTYDGTWPFFFRLENETDELEIWDGDMDHGAFDCSTLDTDDPNTPNTSLPPWAAPTTNFEGVAQGNFRACGSTTGAPNDDSSIAAAVRPPSVFYCVSDPLGGTHCNGNPSGNLEWERFVLGTSASGDPATDPDVVVGQLPAGIYLVKAEGVDLTNLNAWRLPETICITDGGQPCTVLCPDCGTGTPGYWMNHPEAWPVVTIVIGGVVYTREEAIAWMFTGGGDATLTMFRALVAAKLNVLSGTDPTCIEDVIAEADAWMATWGPVGSGVSRGGRNSPWRTGEPLARELDRYNNGELCAPSRDSLE